MKKSFSTLLILLIFSFNFLFSANAINEQKIFSVHSLEYKAIRDLYVAKGLSLPSTSGPWSQAELNLMLSRINKEDLSEDEKELFEFAETNVNRGARFSYDDMFAISSYLEISPELYVHFNKKSFSEPEEYGTKVARRWGDYNQPTPLLSLPLETWVGSAVYGYTSLDLGTVRNIHSLATPIFDGNSVIGFDFLGTNINHNLIFLGPTRFSDFNMNFPLRAFGSIGGEWWNISIGRDKLSWGPGETGNFIIGDQIPYHNNARISFFTDKFKYIFSISTFVHPENYMKVGADDKWYYSPSYAQDKERNGLNMFIAHRLEWRIHDKVGLVLTEGMMYQNSNGSLDLSVLSPTAIFHNFYIRGNSNSILSIEADVALRANWNLYLQFVLDDLQMAGEYTEASKDSNPPPALGIMLGTRFSYPLNKGSLYGSIETAYTTPYLYMRDDGSSHKGDKYGNNFIVAFPEFVSDDSSYSGTYGTYTLDYLGYRYGGDAIVLNLNTGYEKYGAWYVESNIMYMLHGTFDVLTRWMGGDDSSTPTTEEKPGSYDKNNKPKDSAAHYFIVSLEGGLKVLPYLDIFARTDFIYIWNKDNIKRNHEGDCQISLRIKYYI